MGTERKVIPSILWSYWEGPTTKLHEPCLQSWRKHLPQHNIRVLGRSDVDWVVPDSVGKEMFDSLRVQARSDLVRLTLLYRYGGIWLDRTAYLRQGLQGLLGKPEGPVSVIGYRYHNNPLENWFLAAPPNSQLIGKWLQGFIRILEAHRGHPENVEYFACYRAFRQLLAQDGEEVVLRDASIRDWSFAKNSLCIYASLCSQPIVKYTQDDRRKARKIFRFPLAFVYAWIVLVLICLAVTLCLA